MAKNICVIGTGSLGLITAVGLADFGNNVVAVDKNPERIKMLQSGKSPIIEPAVEEYLLRNLRAERLNFSTDINSAIYDSEVVFIAVGTPESHDERPNMSHVISVIQAISENLNSYKTIVIKSTVPVGTNKKIENFLRKICSGGEFDVVTNPEFLREGSSVSNFFHPDRTVIGCNTRRARQVMFDVYRSLNLKSVPFLWSNPETAELIKYASNAFLATKITFINQMANLAEKVDGDIHKISIAMGLDERIGSKFLNPGPGYGGRSIPRDTKAIVHTAEQHNVDLSLIREVIESNEKQKKRVVTRLEELVENFENLTVAVLGLAFKQNTKTVRESPAKTIVNELIFRGADVRVHDPEAMGKFRKLFPYVTYCKSSEEACTGAEILIIVTDWNEYRSLDAKRLRQIMKGNIIYDTRHILDYSLFLEQGFNYLSIGREKFTLYSGNEQLNNILT
jgi:UDPglucose 6-dehydrogenase